MEQSLNNLRALLEKVNPASNTIDVDETFCGIAQMLFNEVGISKGGTTYRILEIEFYYISDNYPMHIDSYPIPDKLKEKQKNPVYKRNANCGDWFFHAYGIDLCFKSEQKNTANSKWQEGDYYGGILIRSIIKEGAKDEEVILGPVRTADTLFNRCSAFGGPYDSDIPQLVGVTPTENKYKRTPRYHIEYRKIEENEGLRFVVEDFEKKFKEAKGTLEHKRYFYEEHFGRGGAKAWELIRETNKKEGK